MITPVLKKMLRLSYYNLQGIVCILSGNYMLRAITLLILLKGYSQCDQSTLWVYFFSQICYYDKLSTAYLFGIISLRLTLERNENRLYGIQG